MYKITERLATHGIGYDYIAGVTDLKHGKIDKYTIVDVRNLLDEPQPLEVYRQTIDRALEAYRLGPIVICCSAGQSRSNSIAIAVLTYEGMDYYDAYNLVDSKVPIMNIEPCHISAIKEILHVGIP